MPLWRGGTRVATGTISMYGGAAAPSGYLLCNGALYPTATYPALFAVLGYAYGGAGANFGVPNLKVRFPKGYESGVNALGDTGGAATHTHTPTMTSDSAGTPSGSIGSAAGTQYETLSPAGKGVFTGDAMETHSHTPSLSTDNGEPEFQVVNYIVKT